MKLRNSFDSEDRQLFSDSYECWYCGMNSCDSLHHIVGRGQISSTIERSILNAAPICNFKCHLKHHGKLMTESWQRKLLKKTYQFLIQSGYNLTETDELFFAKYQKLYANTIR